MSSASDGGDLGPERRIGSSDGNILAAPSGTVPRRSDDSTTSHPEAPQPNPGAADPQPNATATHRHPASVVRESLSGLFTGIATLLTAGPASIVAIITVWLFAFFPWLRPWEPPVEQKLAIANAVVAEQEYFSPIHDENRLAVFFDVEAIGYDRQPVYVATLWLDAITGKRLDQGDDVHGRLTSNIRTNRWVHWIDVQYPTFPEDSSRCLFIRVMVFLAPEGELATPSPNMDTLVQQDARLLAYADTPAFHPYNVDDAACAALEETA